MELDAAKLFAALASKNEHLALSYLHHSHSFEQINMLDDQGRTILSRALQEDLTAVAECVFYHEDFQAINARDAVGRTAMHWAAIKNKIYIVEKLLEPLTDRTPFTEANTYDKKGWTVLHHAAARGHREIVRLLCTHTVFTEVQAVYGRDSMNALHLAARRGHAEVCTVLLENSLMQKSNLLTRKCWTALHCAAFSGHPNVIEALLTCKHFGESTINSRDNSDGWNALHVAAVHGSTKACLALMNGQRFTALTDRDWHRRTALHLAALRGNAAVCLVLLEHPRYPHSEILGVDRDMRTALHTCVSLGHYQASLLLLTHPRFTSRYQVDTNGLTAHDMASGELLRVWNELLIFESMGTKGKENYETWLADGGETRRPDEDKGMVWRREQLGEIFDMLDLDNNGSIGWKEMMRLGEVRRRNYHKVFASMKGTWSKEMCLELIAKMEPGSQPIGGQQKIDRLEFTRYFQARLPNAEEKFKTTIQQFKEALLAVEDCRTDEETTIADGLTPCRSVFSP